MKTTLHVIGNFTIHYSAYVFLFTFHRNYASIYLVPFLRDMASYLSKVANFPIPRTMPHAFSVGNFGVTPLEFHQCQIIDIGKSVSLDIISTVQPIPLMATSLAAVV